MIFFPRKTDSFFTKLMLIFYWLMFLIQIKIFHFNANPFWAVAMRHCPQKQATPENPKLKKAVTKKSMHCGFPQNSTYRGDGKIIQNIIIFSYSIWKRKMKEGQLLQEAEQLGILFSPLGTPLPTSSAHPSSTWFFADSTEVSWTTPTASNYSLLWTPWHRWNHFVST